MLIPLLQIAALMTGTLVSAAAYRWWSIRQQRLPAPDPLSLIQQPDEAVSMIRATPDSITIRWSQVAPQVTVRLSSTPEIPPPHPMILSVVGEQSVTFADLDPYTRYYAEVVFDNDSCFKIAERVVPLPSVPNFRDMGGYQTTTGRRVRWHRVYRASRLSNLTERDAQTLLDMGIRLVCDLRTAAEVAAEPDTIPDGINFLHLPAETMANRWIELARTLFQYDYLPNLLLNAYTQVMLDENPQVFAGIMRELADETRLPVIIHCAAGKDRSGIAIALILSLLGVPDEVIIADYTLSNTYYEFFREATQRVMLQLQVVGVAARDFDYLLIADGEVMRQTFAHLRTHYGSVENYLRTAAQVDEQTLERVKLNLLE